MKDSMSDNAATQETDGGTHDLTLASLGCSVHWSDGYDNEPTLQIGVNGDLPRGKYRSIKFDTNEVALSGEQLAVVGARNYGRPKMVEVLYYEHECGYVRFISVGKETRESVGRGGSQGQANGKFDMEDGTVRDVYSGWHTGAGYIGGHGNTPELINVSINTPRYENVNMAGFWVASKAFELVEQCLPHVEIIQGKYGPSFKFKDLPSKTEWREMERHRRKVEAEPIYSKHGFVQEECRYVPDVVYKDPAFKEIDSIRPYSQISVANQINWVDETRMVCNNCQKMIPITGHTRDRRIFASWVRHYHFCVPQ